MIFLYFSAGLVEGSFFGLMLYVCTRFEGVFLSSFVLGFVGLSNGKAFVQFRKKLEGIQISYVTDRAVFLSLDWLRIL